MTAGSAPSATVVTASQLASEALVPEVWRHPAIAAARTRCKGMMLGAYGIDIPDEARSRFDLVIDEYVTSYILRALVRDRRSPSLVWHYYPPFERAGRSVLGSRFCGDNPDCYYRYGGLEHGRHYQVHGRPTGPVPTATSFALIRNYGGTNNTGTIEYDDLVKEADGSFTLSIDGEPANGRPNHLQTDPRTVHLLVREVLNDWATESPLDLEFVCEEAPGGDPEIDVIAAEAAHWMVDEIPLYFWMNHLFRNVRPNATVGPFGTAIYGGHAQYLSAQGFGEIGEDEALVIDLDPAGAPYAGIMATDWWFAQMDAHRIQSSLNAAQAARNADGTMTAIFSARDPGFTNWIDLSGIHHALLTFRWYGRFSPVRQGPKVSAKLVNLREIEAHVPPDMARMTPAERQVRDAARLDAFARRIGGGDFNLA